MSEAWSDSELDARLRGVPVPAGLRDRLRQAATPRDEDLDAEIRAVSPPNGYLKRLHAAVVDGQLEERVRDVAIPPSLLPRLHVIPQLRFPRRAARLALAASLIIALTSTGWASLAALVWSMRPAPTAVLDPLLVDAGPLNLRGSWSEPEELIRVEIAGLDDDRRLERDLGFPDIQLERFEPSKPGPADLAFVAFQEPNGWWTDVLRLRWGPLGAPQSSGEDLPELEDGPILEPRGIEPPRMSATDRQSLLRDHTLPPLFPGRDELLRTAVVPLTSSTASLDRTRRCLTDGRLPRPHEVRVEDFLAAVPYRFGKPAGRPLALRTAAGPNPFGDGRSNLLLLGVQAADTTPRTAGGTHLTVAIDVSESMRWGGRMERARQALTKLLDDLSPDDRLSLIAFDEELVRVVEQAGVADATLWRDAVRKLQASGGTNLSAGLQQAVSLGLEPTTDAISARRLAVITDGRAALPDKTQEALKQLVVAGTEQGLQIHFLHVGERSTGLRDGSLGALAEAAGTEVAHRRNAAELGWSLRELLTGSSSIIAEDAVLRIQFEPRVVAAYRLIGHEANSLAMVQPADVPASLRVGQTTASLLEIWLHPGNEDLVGWAELEFRDPRSGKAFRQRQRISRLQIAPSFDESPLNLQAASVAAEAAEILRENAAFELAGPETYRTRTRPRNWQKVLEQAEQVSPGMRRRPGFEALLNTIRKLERTRRGSRGA